MIEVFETIAINY